MRTSKEIRRTIRTLCRSAATLQDKLHAVAVECLEHVAAHGDVSLLSELVNELPAGQRRDAIKRWAVDFAGGCLKVKGDVESGFAFSMAAKWREHVDAFLIEDRTEDDGTVTQGARSVPYYAHSAENKPLSTMDLAALIKLLRNKAAAKTRDDGTERVDPVAREAAAKAAEWLSETYKVATIN